MPCLCCSSYGSLNDSHTHDGDCLLLGLFEKQECQKHIKLTLHQINRLRKAIARIQGKCIVDAKQNGFNQKQMNWLIKNI